MESLITAGWLGLIGSRSALSTGLTNPEALEAITSTLPYRCDLISVDRRPHYHHIHLQDRTSMAQGLVAQEHQTECNTGDHGPSTARQAPATKVFGQPV
ncbi:hypothetical protein CEP52_000668 [Fusarium oligoseptatum]|uniref:Uncharacterized protein n=1 Tax=Fusarium oligoseptatum TaxID=2604345 RepID=A0A428UN06_9HYPO|nr:hypothetical protein CEP52_000668 [Fusarium oligoseptatum]